MSDTGCPHPESDVVDIGDGSTIAHWCMLCGSLRDDNGYLASAGEWIAPTGLVLPGWTCLSCGAMNGSLKAVLPTCRGCGVPRGTHPLTGGSSSR